MSRNARIKTAAAIVISLLVILLIAMFLGYAVTTGYKNRELQSFTSMGLQKERAAFINLAENGYTVEPQGLLEGAELAARGELGPTCILTPGLVKYRAYSDLLWSSVWNGTGFTMDHDNKEVIFNPVTEE